jgi:mono/diheme cytochrome c family protein
MKTVKKVLLGLILVLVLAVVGGYSYMMLAFPSVSTAPDLKVDLTPERIARGKYLAEHVTMCVDCHTERDYTRFAAPVVEGTYGKGGEVFNETMGLPGNFVAPNITPASLKDWTDGELYRAITAGVSRDGRALFPIMPYPVFGRLDKEDIYSIIAYLRSMEPVEHKTPASEAHFPMSLIMRTIPADASHGTRPDPSDKRAYGAYLTMAAVCADCHTPMDKGAPIPGKDFAGGAAFELPIGTLRSANITPDKETGIGNWTEDMFVQRFKAFADSAYTEPALGHGDFNTIMPWRMYGHMTEQDLRAIYTHLMAQKPVRNAVERFTPKR